MVKYFLLFIIVCLFYKPIYTQVLEFVSKNTLRNDVNTAITPVKIASSSDYYFGKNNFNFGITTSQLILNYRVVDFMTGNYKTIPGYYFGTVVSLGVSQSTAEKDYLHYLAANNNLYILDIINNKTSPGNLVGTGNIQTGGVMGGYAKPINIPPNPSLGVRSLILIPYTSLFSLCYVNTPGSPGSIGPSYFTSYPVSSITPAITEYDGGIYVLLIDTTSAIYVFQVGFGLSYLKTYDSSLCTAGRKDGIAVNGVYYSPCGLSLQVFDLTSSSTTYVSSHEIFPGYVMGAAYDNKQEYFFFTTYHPTTYVVSVVAVSANKTDVVSYNVLPTADVASSLPDYYNAYPIVVYNQNNIRKLFIVSNAGSVIEINYKSFCTNDCGGPARGTCILNVCQCNTGAFSLDCTKYINPIDPIPYTQSQPTSITITGNGFPSTASSYTGSNILSVPLTDFQYINTTTIVFNISSINYITNANPSPFSSYSLMLVIDGNAFELTNYIKFANPIVNNIELTLTSFLFNGDNFYTNSYMVASIETSVMACTSTKSIYSCTLPVGVKSGTLKLVDTNGTVYYDSFYVIAPILESLNPTQFKTSPTNVIINGKFFTSFAPGYDLKIIQDTAIIPSTIVSDTQLKFQSLNSITNTTIKVSVSSSPSNIVYSNSITFSYIPPTVTEFSQQDESKYIIVGDNFGTNSALVVFNDTRLSISEMSHTYIIVVINSNAIVPFSSSFSVFNQNANQTIDITPVVIISSIVSPSVSGGPYQVSGTYLIGSSIYKAVVVGVANDELLSCTPASTSNNPAQLNCIFPPGSGYFSLYATFPTYKGIEMKSTEVYSNYQLPVITDIFPKEYLKDRLTSITIQGFQFKNQSAFVHINTEPCLISSLTESKIICSIESFLDPQPVVNPVTVIVSIDLLTASNNNTLSYKYSCPNDCSGYGTCNTTIGECSCQTMHTGNDCSVFLCLNDCSSHGTCNNSNGICTCSSNYTFSDCSLLKPFLTEIPEIPMLTTGLITMRGYNLQESFDFRFTGILNESHTISDYNVYDNGTILEIDFNFANDLNYPNLTISFFKNNVKISDSYNWNFSTPHVTDIVQEYDSGVVSLVLTIENSYSPFNYQINIGSETPMFSSIDTGTSVECTISANNLISGPLEVIGFGNIIIYNQFYKFQPLITGISPSTFTTDSMTVTINGYMFKSSSAIPLINEGSSSKLANAANVSSTQIIFSSLNGINPESKLFVSLNSSNSNNITYSYKPPTLSAIDQINNTLILYGSNYGVNAEYAQVNYKDYSCSIQSITHTMITCNLPNNVRNSDVNVTILGQDSPVSNCQLEPNILTLNPLPLTDSTSISMSGNYLRDTIVYLGNVNLNCSVTTQGDSNYPVDLNCDFIPGTGFFNLTLTNLENDFLISQNFSYHPATVTSIQPTTYEKNIRVNFTITGNSFSNTSENVTVYIENEVCEIISISYTEIQCSLLSTQDQKQISNPVQVDIVINLVGGRNKKLLQYNKVCPNECSNHGTCVKSTGVCRCNSSYKGNDCSILKEISAGSTTFNHYKIYPLLFILLFIIFI